MYLVPVDIPGDRLIDFDEASRLAAHGRVGVAVSFLFNDHEVGPLNVPAMAGDPEDWLRQTITARKALLQALLEGAVSAFVCIPGTRDLRRIPSTYWATPGADNPAVVFIGMPSAEKPPVLLDRIDVERWRSLRNVPAATRASKSPLPFDRNSRWEDTDAWYQNRVTAAPTTGYTREQDIEAGALVGIGRDRIRDMRKRLAPAAWHKVGRKPRSN
jgi:hypothetical protein